MVWKKKKKKIEEDEEEEEDDDDEPEEEDEEGLIEVPKEKPKKKPISQSDFNNNVASILNNYGQRISAIESALFRLKSSL